MASKLTALKTTRTEPANDLAKRANVNVFMGIINVESGGKILHHEAQRIADALSSSLGALGQTD